MITAYIVRHGETLKNIQKLVQGWCDSPLTPRGETQARMLGQEMKDICFCAAYSGDLGRQQRTAEIILSENKAAVPTGLKIDPRFREISFGSFEGKDQTELFSQLGCILSAEGDSFMDIVKGHSQIEISSYVAAMDPEGLAETGEICIRRFREGLLAAASEIEQEQGETTTPALIVTSGAVMGMLIESLDPENRFPRIMGNTDVVVVGIEKEKLTIIKHKAAKKEKGTES